MLEAEAPKGAGPDPFEKPKPVGKDTTVEGLQKT